MSDLVNKEFEAMHLAKIQKLQREIKRKYEKSIETIYKSGVPLKSTSSTFDISSFPDFNKKLSSILAELGEDINLTILNGIKEEWELSMEKNAEVIHKAYKGKNLIDDVERMIYDPRTDALEQFTKRQVAGLNFSDRVWNYTNQFRSEIEQNLYAGISEGKSAAAMARDQIKYMENPEPLFRRVRDAKGKLRLSEAAQKYYKTLGAPGRGVYKSPYKNFMRLTRTTINDSYRQSDMVRYQSLPFVIGYQVNLSNNHPRTDICDALKGVYPKTFVWRHWHPQCMCNCTAKLASTEEYDKYEQAIINGSADNYQFTGVVGDTPSNFKSYVENNKGMMDNWKRKPDWVTENGINI